MAVRLAAWSALAVWWHLAGPPVGSTGAGSPLLWLPAYLVWFALGIGLALVQLLHERGRLDSARPGPWSTIARRPGSCWAVALGLMLVAATPLAGPSMLGAPHPGESLTKNLLTPPSAGCSSLTGVFPGPGGAYARTLGHPSPGASAGSPTASSACTCRSSTW